MFSLWAPILALVGDPGFEIQVERALEGLRSIKEKDIREDVQELTFLSGVCKSCTEQQARTVGAGLEPLEELQERQEAAARRSEAAPVEDVEGKIVEVTLASRPFGLTPVPAGEGYVVLKASEGKPAAKAGVRPGWRLQNLAGEAASGDLAELQAKLKAGFAMFRASPTVSGAFQPSDLPGNQVFLRSSSGLDLEILGSGAEAAELPVVLTFKGLGKLEDFCVSCQAPWPSF